MIQLENYLVLNRYMHHLLGVEDFETLKTYYVPYLKGPKVAAKAASSDA